MTFDDAHVEPAALERSGLARDIEAGIGRRGLPVDQQVDMLQGLGTHDGRRQRPRRHSRQQRPAREAGNGHSIQL